MHVPATARPPDRSAKPAPLGLTGTQNIIIR